MTPEVWVVTYYVAQSDTWMMQGVQGRDECRSVIFRLTSQWPAVQHVSALLQRTTVPKQLTQKEKIVEEWPSLAGPAGETEEEFLSRWRKEMRDAM